MQIFLLPILNAFTRYFRPIFARFREGKLVEDKVNLSIREILLIFVKTYAYITSIL